MTYDEAYNDLYFAVELLVGGQVVHSVRHYYNQGDSVNDGTTRTFTYNDPQHGAVVVEYTGSTEATAGGTVRHRDFSISAQVPFRCIYIVSLNQVLTMFDSGARTQYGGIILAYDIVADGRKSKKFLHSSSSYSEDITPMIVDLWNSCTVSDKSNFGGKLQMWLAWPTHQILRDETSGTIMRGSSYILRDD